MKWAMENNSHLYPTDLFNSIHFP